MIVYVFLSIFDFILTYAHLLMVNQIEVMSIYLRIYKCIYSWIFSSINIYYYYFLFFINIYYTYILFILIYIEFIFIYIKYAIIF